MRLKAAQQGMQTNGPIPEQWAKYRVCRALGWTPTEYDEQSVTDTEWFLKFIEADL